MPADALWWRCCHVYDSRSRHSMTAVAEDVMELEIKVQGMTCNGCTSRVQDTLQVKMQ